MQENVTAEEALNRMVRALAPILGGQKAEEIAAPIRAALSPLQPIETAPEDQFVLITGGQPGYGWDGECGDLPPAVIAKRRGWRWQFAHYDGGYYGEWEAPTHWAPVASFARATQPIVTELVEALRTRVAELEQALKPFSDAATSTSGREWMIKVRAERLFEGEEDLPHMPNVRDFRQARATLSRTKGG